MAKHLMRMTEAEIDTRRLVVSLMFVVARRKGWSRGQVEHAEHALMRQPLHTLAAEFAWFGSLVRRYG